jgi:16S rRNA (adenine1518-N6/adenine1519-N6)-dimethyltransferase
VPPPRTSAQPSLRRLREFDIRPKRALGQSFLVDSNILAVIARAGELSAKDVVLEIGGGVGLLSEYLASRVAHLHVIEVDTRLEPALLDATERFGNVTLHWGDALRLGLASLRPEPQKIVANLPYGVATAALLRTIDELPGVHRWVVMLQREVGERLAAAPGGRAYGATSVIVQLACEVKLLRAIPRTVFYPAPNVDSALVELRRHERMEASSAGEPPEPESDAALRALVYDAFAHRRKALAGSLALAASEGARESAAPAPSRERIREALVQLGHRADARAERLEPEEFRVLAELLAK